MASFASKFRTSVTGSKRMLIVVGVAMVVAVGAWYLSSGGQFVPTSQVRGPLQNSAGVQGTKPVSAAYSTQLVMEDDRRAKAAKESGTTSALPTIQVSEGGNKGVPSESRKPLDDGDRLARPRPPQIETPVVALPQIPAAPAPIRVADRDPQPDMTSNLMRAAMADLGKVAYPAADVKYYYKPTAVQSTDQRALQAQVATGSSPSNGTVGGIPLPLPGTIVYAELVGEANSDAPGPILARILQGDLAGATVIGSFSAGREALVLRFSTLSLGTSTTGEEINKSIPINAVGVDSKTVGSGIATDVDHHFIANVGLQAAAAFAQGLGQAIGQSGQTLTATSGVGYQVVNPARSITQQLEIAGGVAGGAAGAALLQTYGNRPATITIAAGTPVGILFMPSGGNQ